MRLLIDTHILIWWTSNLSQLPTTVQDSLADGSNEIFVSAVSAWEIALKVRLGKLHFDANFLADFDANVRGLSFHPIDVNSAQMIAGAQIQSPHKDPFDRMLAGQALVEQMAIVTADPAFRSLGVQIVW